jgi:type II secretory pathway component PulF
MISLSPPIRSQEKLALISSLATMLAAGVPVLEAVESLLPDSKGGTRKFLEQLRSSLNEGKPISEAMAKAPRSFDPVTVNIVRAAETAGTLDETLKDVEVSMKQDMEFRDQLRASMAYPLFIFVVFLGVLLLILGFVIPRVAKVFATLRMQLPATTRAMIWVSDALLAHYRLIIILSFVGVALLVILFQLKRRAIVNLLLYLPVFRSLGREIDLARFTRSMAQLLKAGVPVGEALKLSRAVVAKKEMVAMVDHMEQAINQGKPMSDGLQASKHAVPSLMIRLIETAERSGSLEMSMQNLSEHFQTRISQRLKTIATLIEPVMIVVVGLLVGGMMLSIIAPIYNLIGKVKAR